MATTHFQGGTGDWGDNANWSGSEPVSTDTAIIDAGSVTVNAGLGNTAVDLALLWISPGYTGNIGSSGGRLEIAADLIVHLGSGELWLKCADNSAGLSVDRMVICTANPSTVVNVSGDAGALDHVQVLRGTVTMSERPNTLLEVGYKTSKGSDANVTVAAGAGVTADVIQNGGTLTTNDEITTMNFFGGRWTHATATDTLTEVNLLAPGNCVFNANATITTCRVGNGATLDLMQSQHVKTITTLWEMPGGRVLMDKDSGTVHIVTTHHELNRLGRR